MTGVAKCLDLTNLAPKARAQRPAASRASVQTRTRMNYQLSGLAEDSAEGVDKVLARGPGAGRVEEADGAPTKAPAGAEVEVGEIAN